MNLQSVNPTFYNWIWVEEVVVRLAESGIGSYFDAVLGRRPATTQDMQKLS